MARVIINNAVLRQSLREQIPLNQKFQQRAEQAVRARADRIKTQIGSEFEDLAVVNELENPNKPSDNFVQYNRFETKGVSNLFSYLGFEKGEDPVQAVRAIIKKRLQVIGRKVNNKNGSISYQFALPTLNQLRDVAKLPYSSEISWIDAAENGISSSNVNDYLVLNLVESNKSRSGYAIQVNFKNNNGGTNNFTPKKEISLLLEQYFLRMQSDSGGISSGI